MAPLIREAPAGPMTLAEFLRYTGWKNEYAPALARIKVALDFYQAVVPWSTLSRLEPDPSPWALPRGRPTMRLTQWMQSIDFGDPVRVLTLGRGFRLKAYVRRDADRPRHFFTSWGEEPARLGIPRDQDIERFFEVSVPVQALHSTVSDAYVDWVFEQEDGGRKRQPPAYRKGRGEQLFIWDAARHLRRVSQQG